MIWIDDRKRPSWVWAAAASIVCVLVPQTASAQPTPGKAQPNALGFGTVRVGATAEGSVRVFGNAGDSTQGIEAGAKAPVFARVTDAQLGTQEYGSLGTKIVYDVSVAIDTARPGKYSGPMNVKIDQLDVQVPISFTVLPGAPGLTRVLVVETPFQKFSTDDAGLFDAWLEIVKAGKLDPHYLNVTRDQSVFGKLDLARFDVILLAETGLFMLEEDRKRVVQFLDHGGRVVLAANYFFRGSVDKVNELLAGFGMAMGDLEDASKKFRLSDTEVAQDLLTRGVKSLSFYRASPIRIVEPAMAKILVEAPPFPDQGFVAVARSGKAEIIVLGKSLWWDWVCNEAARNTDNARLLQNLLARKQEN